MPSENTDKPGVIAPPPLIYANAFLASLLLQSRIPLPFLPRAVKKFIGIPLIIIAITGFISSIRLMKRAGTNINPTLPTTALILTGPYRISRNPIYLSMTLLYIGLATLANALWSILVLPIVLLIMNKGVIAREERYLENKFGKAYREYKQQVRRWI